MRLFLPKYLSLRPSSLYAAQSASGSSSSSTPIEPSNGPQLTVPATGRYRVQWACVAGAASGEISLFLYRGSTQVVTKGGLANTVAWTLYSTELTLVAGEVLTIRGQNAGSVSTIYDERSINLTYLSER